MVGWGHFIQGKIQYLVAAEDGNSCPDAHLEIILKPLKILKNLPKTSNCCQHYKIFSSCVESLYYKRPIFCLYFIKLIFIFHQNVLSCMSWNASCAKLLEIIVKTCKCFVLTLLIAATDNHCFSLYVIQLK